MSQPVPDAAKRSLDSASQSHAGSETAGERERRQITGRAGIVAAGTLLSRLLGLVRDQLLAAIFVRAATDAFWVAFTIPNVLRQLLAEGAVQNAVLPVLSETRHREGEASARDFFRAMRGLSLLILLSVSLAGIVFAPELVALFAAGFRDDPRQFERTVTLTRWLFPYIFFMGTAALGLAALNTYHRFVVTSFAPALLNVAFIACAILLPGWLAATGRDRILAMAAGALFGGALQVVAQWPSLRKIDYLAWPRLTLSHPGVRKALRRMGPVLFGVGIYYIDVLLARRFLSELDEGSLSFFSFAQRLCDFPQGIFVMALQAATLPSLALLVARGETEEVERTFAFGMRLALFVGLGASALFVGLAEPLVVLIFQRGHFDAVASRETAESLVALGLGIWMVAAVRQLVAVYYALGDTRTPVIVSAIDLCVFIGLALWLRGPFGHVGISMAVTGASGVQMVFLWTLLKWRLTNLHTPEVLGSAARSLLCAVTAAAIGYLVALSLARSLGESAFERALPGVTGALVFGAAFLLCGWLFRSDELRTIAAPVLRRVVRR